MKLQRIWTTLGAFGLGATLVVNAQETQKALTDAEFVKKAASDGIHEVMLGKIAQERAMNPEVKMFGHHMAVDHQKANEELKAAAKAASLEVPEMMLPKHQKEVERLQGLKGSEFDRAYMEHMVKGHEKAVAMFQQASQQSKH